MKRIKGLFMVTLMLTFGVTGQSTKQNISMDSDRSDVAKAVEALYRAMVDKDGKTLDRLTAESLTYGHSSGTIENKSEYIEAVLHGSFDFSAIEPAEQRIYFSGRTAIVRHYFVAEGTNNGEPTNVRIGAMLVFQKQSGQWKLLARQAYKL